MIDNVEVLTHSAIRIRSVTEGTIVYFDPFDLAIEPHDADVIFITHDHYDHFSVDDARKVAKATTIMVAPETCRENILKAGVGADSLVTLDPEVETEICGIPVKTVPAYNVGKPFHPRESKWFGYVVTLDGIRYYVAGDTDANVDNLSVTCEVALVPCGGTYTFDPREAADFVNKVRPKAAIPTHYGTIVGQRLDGALFERYVDPAIKVVLKL